LTASFPSGKEISHQGIVLVDDKIWHIGGRAVNADGPVSSQVIIYDITNNSWKDGPQLKDPATGQAVPLGGGGAVLLGRTIHVFGGFSPTICIDQNKYHLTLDIDKWLADPLHTSWENKSAPLPTPRNHLSVTVLGGKIYALGGQFSHDCSGADQKYCHVYDAVTNTWTRLTDLPSPRSHTESSTYPIDGKIFMLGGQGTSGAAQSTAFIFTTEANNSLGSWSNATQYKLPLAGAVRQAEPLPALGDYTLKGTPYSASNAGGTTGTSLTVNFTVINQTQSSSDLITGISSATGNSYTLNNLAVDELIYTDRTYKFTSVPAFLNNAPYIKTPNDDKANKSTAALTFNLTKNATVYIGYDPRATTLPAWLSGWQKLTDKLGVDDPNISSLVLYSKTYPAGKVTLGGNLASPAAGALNQYCVVAKAQTQAREIVVTSKTGKEADSTRLKGLSFVNQDKIKNAFHNFSKTNSNNPFINYSSKSSFKAYPNPFTKNTKIYYTLKKKANVSLSVNSIQGQQMELLVDGLKAAGNYNAIFDASKFASGIYIYKLQIGNEVIAGKLVKE